MAPIIKISASKMTVAEQCQFHYWLRYVKNLKVFSYSHPAAAVGSLFHRADEMWYSNHKLKGTPLSLEALKACVRQAFDSCVAEKKFILPPEYIAANRASMEAEATDLLEKFYEDETKRGTLVAPSWIEKKFSMTWDTGKGFSIMLNGFIDRMAIIAGEAFITDYKTSSILKTQAEVDEDHQLTFYSAAYRDMAKNSLSGLPIAEKSLELYFPKFRKYVVTYRTAEHFADLKARLFKIGEMEIHELKNATPSKDACMFCEYAGGECKLTPFCKPKTA